MSRRPVALFILAITSFVLAACTSITSPTTTHNDCPTGSVGSDGIC